MGVRYREVPRHLNRRVSASAAHSHKPFYGEKILFVNSPYSAVGGRPRINVYSPLVQWSEIRGGGGEEGQGVCKINNV